MTTNTAIQLKKSGQTGNTPADLALGEVAINYADGKLYYKNDLNAIRYITNQDTFGTVSANGSLILATSPTDVLTITPNNNIKIVGIPGNKEFTIDLSNNITVTNNVISQNVVALKEFYAGIATYSATPLPNLIAQFTGNTDSYVQVNAQNIDPHGSADYVATADVGDDTTFYIDMGIQNSQQDFGNIKRLDGYLYVQGNTGQLGGNLVVGTSSGTSGLETRIVSGGLEDENVIVRFTSNGANVANNLIVGGSITSPTITNLQNYTQAAFDKANTGTGSANAFSVISVKDYTDIIANAISNTLTFEAQTGIAIGTDAANAKISIATNLIGASNVIVDFGSVIDTIGAVTFDYGYVS
jgi:hypothetical protein